MRMMITRRAVYIALAARYKLDLRILVTAAFQQTGRFGNVDIYHLEEKKNRKEHTDRGARTTRMLQVCVCVFLCAYLVRVFCALFLFFKAAFRWGRNAENTRALRLTSPGMDD